MAQGDNLKRENLPTMQLLRYLTELEKQGGKRGSVTAVAKACGVHHGSVSRYLKICCELGYLTEDYTFTERGKTWLAGYQRLLEDLPVFLRKAGVPEREIPQNVKNLIENTDYLTLTAVLRYDRNRKDDFQGKNRAATRNILSEVLEYGTSEVFFLLLRVEHGQDERGISMANRGFRKPGLLRHNRRGSWLELTICEMSAHSNIDGAPMEGHLQSLKYEQGGVLHLARITGGRLRLPLEACTLRRRSGGGIRGELAVTVTCNVGRVHMPESTAMLVFWL